MNDLTIKQRLDKLDIDDDEAIDGMANAVTERAFEETKLLIEYMHGSDDVRGQKAAAVLSELGVLVSTPMLQEIDDQTAENFVWEMETVISAQISIRVGMAERLNSMMSDRRDVPIPELLGAVEETPAQRRVCDDAYLLLRRLLAFEDSDEELINEGVFLEMSFEERDQEISRIQSSRRWIALTELLGEGHGEGE